MTRTFESYTRSSSEAGAALALTQATQKLQLAIEKNTLARQFDGGRFRPAALEHLTTVALAVVHAEMVIATNPIHHRSDGGDVPYSDRWVSVQTALIHAVEEMAAWARAERDGWIEFNDGLPDPPKSGPLPAAAKPQPEVTEASVVAAIEARLSPRK